MKIPLTVKQMIWLFLAVVVTAFLLAGFVQAILSFASTGSDWASALIQSLGNIIGGLLGGIVAIIVAAYQISKTLQNESKKQLKTSSTMLKLIREELRDNVTVLESVIPYSKDSYTILKTQLSDDIWKSTLLHLVISDNLLVKLNVAYRKTCLFRNLSSEEIYDDLLKETKEQLNHILQSVNEEIKNIDSVLIDNLTRDALILSETRQ